MNHKYIITQYFTHIKSCWTKIIISSRNKSIGNKSKQLKICKSSNFFLTLNLLTIITMYPLYFDYYECKAENERPSFLVSVCFLIYISFSWHLKWVWHHLHFFKLWQYSPRGWKCQKVLRADDWLYFLSHWPHLFYPHFFFFREWHFQSVE